MAGGESSERSRSATACPALGEPREARRMSQAVKFRSTMTAPRWTRSTPSCTRNVRAANDRDNRNNTIGFRCARAHEWVDVRSRTERLLSQVAPHAARRWRNEMVAGVLVGWVDAHPKANRWTASARRLRDDRGEG